MLETGFREISGRVRDYASVLVKKKEPNVCFRRVAEEFQSGLSRWRFAREKMVLIRLLVESRLMFSVAIRKFESL